MRVARSEYARRRPWRSLGWSEYFNPGRRRQQRQRGSHPRAGGLLLEEREEGAERAPEGGRSASEAPSGARRSMRRPRDHGLQDQVSAAGQSRAGPGRALGRRGRARAAGRGPRWGTCCGDRRGAPRGRVKQGGGWLPWGCGRLRDGVRARWRVAGDEMSSPHLREGTADMTRRLPLWDVSQKTVVQLLGGKRFPELSSHLGVFGATLRVGRF